MPFPATIRRGSWGIDQRPKRRSRESIQRIRTPIISFSMKRVLYTAAHSGFSLASVPLGGGAAVCAQLMEEWRKTQPFDLQLLGPGLLGDAAPRNDELV